MNLPRIRKLAAWGKRVLWHNRVSKGLLFPFAVAVNNVLILCRLDGLYVRWRHEWKGRLFWKTKSLRENVGFSHRPDVDEALARVHAKLTDVVEAQVPHGRSILDIGSGTGLVAKLFAERWRVLGLDISAALTEVAREQVPKADFRVGDILEVELEEHFRLAYCIGVLCYIPPSQLRRYMQRIHDVLEPGGIIFLQYPHAIARSDLWHPNLMYTKYSPATVERVAGPFFDVIEHHHSFYPERAVTDFDREPFPRDSFVNGYLYLGRRKSVP